MYKKLNFTRTIEGVTFTCYKTGAGRRHWATDDGSMCARYNSGSLTYRAWVTEGTNDIHIVGTRFLSLENAMRAAIRHQRKKGIVI